MQNQESPQFTKLEKKVLQIVQDNLPDSQTPFLEIARQVGVEESFVLELLERLKHLGLIRRFGATLKHQEAGYGCNVMVAWLVRDLGMLETTARAMSECPQITHCYQRKSTQEWPYNLYTMVHGKNKQDCLQIIKDLQKITQIEEYELLFSDTELKKTSMKYF